MSLPTPWSPGRGGWLDPQQKAGGSAQTWLSHSEPSRGCAGGRFSRSRPPLSLQPCLLSSAATCILLMVFNLTRSGPTPGPLHWLCLLPRTLFPRCLNGPCPHFLPVFSKRDLFLKKKKNLKKFHLLIIFGFPRSQLQPKGSLLRHAGFFLAMYELSSCDTQTSFLHGVWDLRSPTRD